VVSDAITLSGVTIPAARRLAAFHPAITGGTVSLADDSWATLTVPAGCSPPRDACTGCP